MDAVQRLWQDDYRREVEEVLARMRAEKTTTPRVVPSVIDAVLPPAGLAEDLRQARERLSRLEHVLEEARARLSSNSAELERERVRRERLKGLVVKLHWTAGKLEADRQAALERADEHAKRLNELGERLREATGRAEQSAVAGEEDRARALQWQQDLRRLQARVDELQLKLDQQKQAAETAERRLEAANQAHELRYADVERARRELEERLKDFERDRQAHSERQAAGRAVVLEQLSSSARETQAARDEAAGLMARLDQALLELKAERESRAEGERARAAKDSEHVQLELKARALEDDLDQARSRLKDALLDAAKHATNAAVSKKDAEGARGSSRGLEEKLNEALAGSDQLRASVNEAEQAARLSAAAAEASRRELEEARVLLEKSRADSARAVEQAQARVSLTEAQARADVAKAESDAREKAYAAAEAAKEAARKAAEAAQAQAKKEIDEAKALADRAVELARADSAKAAAQARADAAKRLDAVLGEEALMQKELSELREAHERDRQKIVEDCSEALERAKAFEAKRRGEVVSPAPAEEPGLWVRLFGRGK